MLADIGKGIKKNNKDSGIDSVPEVIPTQIDAETEDVVENEEVENISEEKTESTEESSENIENEETVEEESNEAEETVSSTVASNVTTSAEFDEESAGYEVLTKVPKSSASGHLFSFVLLGVAICLL